MIYSINHVLRWVGGRKWPWKSVSKSGAEVGRLFLGLLKTVLGLCEMDQKCPCVVCLNCRNEWLGMCGNR